VKDKLGRFVKGSHIGPKNPNWSGGRPTCEVCGKLISYGYKRCIKHKVDKNWNITKKKIGIANSGERNGMWKGNKVRYNALHNWINNHKPKPKFCERCGIKSPFDVANISGKYKRDVNDFEWLCRSCHMKIDGRINNLKH